MVKIKKELECVSITKALKSPNSNPKEFEVNEHEISSGLPRIDLINK